MYTLVVAIETAAAITPAPINRGQKERFILATAVKFLLFLSSSHLQTESRMRLQLTSEYRQLHEQQRHSMSTNNGRQSRAKQRRKSPSVKFLLRFILLTVKHQVQTTQQTSSSVNLMTVTSSTPSHQRQNEDSRSRHSTATRAYGNSIQFPLVFILYRILASLLDVYDCSVRLRWLQFTNPIKWMSPDNIELKSVLFASRRIVIFSITINIFHRLLQGPGVDPRQAVDEAVEG